jgi:hypothetical protein
MASPGSTIFPNAGLYPLGPPGKRITVSPGTPAAGAEVIIRVPDDVLWRILTVRAKLTTSVAVANRLPGFILDDGQYTTQPIYESDQESTALAASSNRIFSMIVAHASEIQSNVLVAGNVSETRFFVPELALLTLGLPPGSRIRTKTQAIDVADQWTNVSLYVEEVKLIQP